MLAAPGGAGGCDHHGGQGDARIHVVGEDAQLEAAAAEEADKVLDARRRGGIVKGEIVERVVTYVAKAIAEEPEAVRVEMIDEGPDEVLAEVRTAKRDMGRVIGRRGRVANAFRTRGAGRRRRRGPAGRR